MIKTNLFLNTYLKFLLMRSLHSCYGSEKSSSAIFKKGFNKIKMQVELNFTTLTNLIYHITKKKKKKKKSKYLIF